MGKTEDPWSKQTTEELKKAGGGFRQVPRGERYLGPGAANSVRSSPPASVRPGDCPQGSSIRCRPSAMGIRLPCGHDNLQLRDRQRRCTRHRLVREDNRPVQPRQHAADSAGRAETAECLGPLRHARQCPRVGARLHRPLSGRQRDRSARAAGPVRPNLAFRVQRGGAWIDAKSKIRCAWRGWSDASFGSQKGFQEGTVGFRVAVVAE